MNNFVVLDCEVYPNYFLVAFKNIDNNKVVTIESRGTNKSLTPDAIKKLRTIMHKRHTFGFNSVKYDMPIILFALKGKTCEEIHKLSDYIILENSPAWMTMNRFDLVQPNTMKHFDISEPSPGVRVSLKLYGGRMNSKRLQDLPIAPGSTLTNQEMDNTLDYCINDLNTTIDLYRNVEDRMQLRFDMSKQYGQDLTSKSDAQIAEVVIKSELGKKQPGKRLKRPTVPGGKTFKYNVPEYIKFEGQQLNEALTFIRQHDFELDGKGSIKLPDELKKMKILLGESKYQLGIGGIHSTEKKQTVVPTENQVLCDRDVAAYYPSIILNLRLYPKHLGPKFLDVYQEIVTERLAAKKSGNTVVNQSLKIVINGSFGKLGSKYSILYSPDLMMTVTLTGQLALLMLIEKLENAGISVVSANTDGFVSLMSQSKYELYDDICFQWELDTSFELEENRYKALYSRDVNNYLAITKHGAKGKGIFTLNQLSKNPQASICVTAVMNLLTNGKPIRSTIMECDDITQFLTIRSVTGGAVWRNEYLGRVVRWIYSTNGEQISYKKNGNKVAKSDKSRPIMELSGMVDDIDYDRYITESENILEDIGLNNL
jgi:hypothetical protein